MKYYKTELNGKTYLRMSKNQYTVAMVRHEEGREDYVISFNKNPVSQSPALVGMNLTWFKKFAKKQYGWEKGSKLIAEAQSEYDSISVYSIPVVEISKEEHQSLKNKEVA